MSLDPDGRELVTVAALTAAPERLEEVLDRQCRRWDADRAVAASLLFGNIVWRVVAPSAACYLAERRVPALAPTTVAFAFDDDGEAAEVTLRSPALLVLPDDPAAAHPHATVVTDRAALRAALRERIVTTVAGLIPALKPWARRGARTQWGEVADRIASGVHWAGTKLGVDRDARVEAQRILDGAPPLTGRANWVQMTHAGRTETFRTRNICCLAYRLADHSYCFTCPLAANDDRLARWRAYLEDA